MIKMLFRAKYRFKEGGHVKKRIVSLSASLAVLFTAAYAPRTLAAERIKIEAEAYTYTSSPLNVTNNTQLSNSKYVRIYNYPPLDGYTIGYSFDVQKSGVYKVCAVGSIRDRAYTSDWDIYMNDESNSSNEQLLLEDIDVPSIKDVMKKYSFGTFRLKKGKNTLYVKVDCDDLQSQDIVVTYLDYFTIEQVNGGKFSVSDLKIEGTDCGVFTEDDNIKMNVEFTASAPEKCEYRLKIKNAWGRDIINSVVTAGKGMDALPVFIGKLSPGWYRAYIYDIGSDEALNTYKAFSVTHSLKKRGSFEDTAFGSDLAAEYDGGTLKRAESFAKAMKYSGFDWIRSRGTGKATTAFQLNMKKQLAARNIKIDEVMGSSVGYVTGESDAKFRNDLYTTSYNFWKEYPKYEDGTVSMVEVFNELDISKNSPGADLYSSYLKAAAIGLADSGYSPYVSLTGLAMYEGLYFDLLMQNGALNYSDVYNFHAHAALDKRVSCARRNSDVYSEGNSIPLYLTEAGIYQIPETEDGLSDEQMRASARYGITSAVTSLSYGTDKHFWFLSRPFIENGGNYSSFHAWSYYPYPVYTSVENMTYQLGEGVYKGEMKTETDGVTGKLFDRGDGSDTAVFWSEKPTYITINADRLIYSDMYGYEETKTGENGKITVSVSEDPIYLRFDGRCGILNYYPAAHTKNVISKHELKTNDRIVIQPLWQNVDMNDSAIKNIGYSLNSGKDYEIDAVIYNMNNEKVSGKISADLSEGEYFDLSVENGNFNIEPWGKQTVKIRLKANGKGTPGKSGEIKIYGTMSDGSKLSPSVGAYNFSMKGIELSPDEVQLFEGSLDSANWDLTNIQASGTLDYSSDKSDGTFTMKAAFSDSSVWYFPKLKVNDASFLEGTSGISFKRKCAERSEDKTTVFVYLSDGREYYSGEASGVEFSDEWETLTYPWTCFSLFKSPLGTVDIREFDESLIEYVAIGVSGGTKDKPSTTISDFGAYTLKTGGGELNPGKIELSGIEYDAAYKKGEVPQIRAMLPYDNLTDIKVMNYNNLFDKWSSDGRSITIDTSGLDRGKYDIKVCAKNNMNYYYVSEIIFYVD